MAIGTDNGHDGSGARKRRKFMRISRRLREKDTVYLVVVEQRVKSEHIDGEGEGL